MLPVFFINTRAFIYGSWNCVLSIFPLLHEQLLFERIKKNSNDRAIDKFSRGSSRRKYHAVDAWLYNVASYDRLFPLAGPKKMSMSKYLPCSKELDFPCRSNETGRARSQSLIATLLSGVLQRVPLKFVSILWRQLSSLMSVTKIGMANILQKRKFYLAKLGEQQRWIMKCTKGFQLTSLEKKML